MLSTIKVVADETITLEVAAAHPGYSYLLKGVSGLNPTDLDLFMGDYARDGGIYSGRRANRRAVGLAITPNPQFSQGETVSDLRRKLQRVFMEPNLRGDAVTLEFYDDVSLDVLTIKGYAEKFENEVFSQDPTVNVSLLCPDPYIKKSQPTVFDGPLWVENSFPYSGTANSGFKLKVEITSDTDTLTLGVDDELDPTNIFQLNLSSLGGFLVGDIVDIDTNYGHRSVNIIRGGITASIFSGLTNSSKWVQLHSENVKLRLGAATPNDQVVAGGLEFSYVATYWGI